MPLAMSTASATRTDHARLALEISCSNDPPLMY
jgi:hypothetical protein